jgi:hypothetical protein
MSKTFSNKNRQNFQCQFSSIFGFIAFFWCFSAMGVKKHNKKRFPKKSCRKVFTKNRQKIQNRIFSVLFSHCFGGFSAGGGGGSKAPSKKDIYIGGQNLTSGLGPFLAPGPEPPTHAHPPLTAGRNPDLVPDPNRLGGHLLVGHHHEA